jgi:glycosyltransferase involved in cell wall biosynthesis
MTSGPPHSVHLIGACLSKLAGIPWVADFRDPYLDDVFLDYPWAETRFSGYLARKLEAMFISMAANILTTNERMTERLRSRYPAHNQTIVTLPNGYDPDDFYKLEKEKEKNFTISYFGSLYGPRNPEPILHALSELINEKQINPLNLTLRFIGNSNSINGKTMESLIIQYGLNKYVELLPWIPRGDAFRLMVRSHVLLLPAEDQPLCVPGKLYEYLATGNDILAISGNGATADLVLKIGAGVVVQPGNHQALKTALKKFYGKYLHMPQNNDSVTTVDSEFHERYSRRCLTGELARLLEGMNKR